MTREITEEEYEEFSPCPENFTLHCYYKNKETGEVIDGWEEPFPDEEVAKELFRRLLLISNNYDYCW